MSAISPWEVRPPTGSPPEDPRETVTGTGRPRIARKPGRSSETLSEADGARGEAHAHLLWAIEAARTSGESVPCVGAGSDRWTSDHLRDQQEAADLCLDCPVFVICRDYVDSHPENGGVWAGKLRMSEYRMQQGERLKQRKKQARQGKQKEPSNL